MREAKSGLAANPATPLGCHPEQKARGLGYEECRCFEPRCPRFARHDTGTRSVSSTTFAAKGKPPAPFDGAVHKWQTGVFSARRLYRTADDGNVARRDIVARSRDASLHSS